LCDVYYRFENEDVKSFCKLAGAGAAWADTVMYNGNQVGADQDVDRYYNGVQPSMTSTPEPWTFVLVGSGLIAMGLIRKRAFLK
jgi:hypothetical protein